MNKFGPIIPRDELDARVHCFKGNAFPAALVEACRNTSRPWIFVEGFMGAGKSMLAKHLSHSLSTDLLELDETVQTRSQSPVEPYTYRGQLCESKLASALSRIYKSGKAVICGVCLREAIPLKRSDALVIYVAACSESVPGQLCWHDGFAFDDANEEPDWLYASILKYHRTFWPQNDADLVLCRVT